MKQPFFSIVIPTRGRPRLLRDTLVSALWQDFDDFEVVVSDNYNDSQTRAVLDEFKGDRRLRCVRTDRLLNMPVHWEFATQHACGEYVLILTDRSVLKQGALKVIHDEISSSDTSVDVCSWRWSVYNDTSGCEGDIQPVLQEGTVHRILSEQLIEDVSSGLNLYNKCLPRGLNGCYRNSFVQRVRGEFGTPFRPLSPDYSLAFTSLATAKDVLFIDRALFISQGLNVSNGTSAFLGKGSAGGHYTKSLGEIDLFAHVPIKCLISNSTIYEDLSAAQELIGGNLKEVEINWSGYFAFCYSELLCKKAWGFMSPDLLQSFFDEWERALSTFDQATQTATKEKIAELPPPPPPPLQLSSMQEIGSGALRINFIKQLIGRLVRSRSRLEKEKVVSPVNNQAPSALDLAGY